MTYEKAEKFADDNLEKIRYHNAYLTDRKGFRIKETIIAPPYASLNVISAIFVNLTLLVDNKISLTMLGLDNEEQYEVYLYTETYGDIFSSQSLNAYLLGNDKA